MPPENLTYFWAKAPEKRFAGLIEYETCCGDAGIPKRATANRPYELLDDPYVKINTVLA